MLSVEEEISASLYFSDCNHEFMNPCIHGNIKTKVKNLETQASNGIFVRKTVIDWCRSTIYKIVMVSPRN